MALNIASALILLQFGAWSCNGDFSRDLMRQDPWSHRLYHDSQRQEQWPQGGDSDVTKFRNLHPSIYHYQIHPQRPDEPQYNRLPTPHRLRTQQNLPGFGSPPQPQPQQQLQGPRHSQRYTPSPRASQAKKNRPAQVASEPCGLVVVNQIIKGNIATRGLFPWQVALFYKNRGVGAERMACSGALIHPRFVLTAAHCLDLRDTKGHILSGVLLGATDLRARDNHTRYYVPDQVTCHSEYRREGGKGERNPADICILRLPEHAPYTDFIRPVCLPREKVPKDLGAQSLVFRTAGWGGMNTTFNPEFSRVLLWVKLPSVSAEACSRQLGRFVNAERQVCAGGQEEDTCQGDSGAGLVGIAQSRDENVFEVVGVLSYGTDLCGQKIPAVFTRVDAFLPWILNILRSN